MNLRILKKLSKRAAPLLPLLGERREIYAAGEDGGEIGFYIMDRKHWRRMRVSHDSPVWEHSRDVKYKAKRGPYWIHMCPPHDGWPGTMMVGEMTGYEEREWSEQTCWSALREAVFWHFAEMKYPTDGTGDAEWPEPVCNRDLSTPKLVFAAAHEILAGRAAQAASQDTGGK